MQHAQAAGKWKNRTESRGKYSSSPIVEPLEDRRTEYIHTYIQIYIAPKIVRTNLRR